jgi:amino acid adenylation domain-containing protein
VTTVHSDDLRTAREGELTLSYAQERLWFLQQLGATADVCNVVAHARVAGELSAHRVEAIAAALSARHDILRTTFATVGGRPVAQLRPSLSLSLAVLPHDESQDGSRGALVARVINDEMSRRFDIEQGPLCHIAVVAASPRWCDVIISCHPLVGDRESAAILLDEFAALAGSDEAAADATGAQRRQHDEIAASQRQRAAAGGFERGLSYWREALGGLLPILDLPTDRPRPPERTYRAGFIEHPCSGVFPDAVASSAGLLGVTSDAILLAGFAVLLQRYTGQDDLLLGRAIARDPAAGLQGVVGPFNQVRVVRADASGRPTFRTLVQRVSAAAAPARDAAEVPFELIVADLRPHRDLSRSAVFQTAMVIEACRPEGALDVDTRGGLPLDLTVVVRPADGAMTLVAEYNADLFDPPTVAQMLARFERMLSAGLAEPDRPIAELPWLSDEEYRRIVHEWNATDAACAASDDVVDLFEAHAAATPDAIAVEGGGVRWTYAELNRRATQIAIDLQEHGAGKETIVGVCIERSPEMLAALLGVLKSGAVYLPLDASYPSDRLAFMLRDSGASALIADSSALDRLTVESLRVLRVDEVRPGPIGTNLTPTRRSSPNQLAYVIYTSGSTGTPKGVQVTRRGLANLLLSVRATLGLHAADRLFSVTTIAFDIAGLELYAPLIAGARTTIASRETATDGHALAAALAESGATIMQATPATWRLLLEAEWRPPAGFRILCGGEALSPELAVRLVDTAETWNMYGPTETTIWSSTDRVSAGDAPTIGRPLANTQIYVLDAALRPVPPGVVGALYIGGDGVARGYAGRPALTAERFIPNPFVDRPGERIYRTGDLARFRPDGRVEWIARDDHQVKIRGYRVELQEVEAAIAAHALVREAVVLAEGEASDRRLVAYMVLEPHASVTVSDLRRFVRSTLPPFMVPAFFVKIDRVPLTANGKVDRRALADLYRAGRSDGGRTLPRSDAERRLAAIWQSALSSSAAIGVHDNFFDVGGHSLLSMRVLATIEQTFGRQLDPRVMFLENLEQIAARLGDGADPAAAAVFDVAPVLQGER